MFVQLQVGSVRRQYSPNGLFRSKHVSDANELFEMNTLKAKLKIVSNH